MIEGVQPIRDKFDHQSAEVVGERLLWAQEGVEHPKPREARHNLLVLDYWQRQAESLILQILIAQAMAEADVPSPNYYHDHYYRFFPLPRS